MVLCAVCAVCAVCVACCTNVPTNVCIVFCVSFMIGCCRIFHNIVGWCLVGVAFYQIPLGVTVLFRGVKAANSGEWMGKMGDLDDNQTFETDEIIRMTAFVLVCSFVVVVVALECMRCKNGHYLQDGGFMNSCGRLSKKSSLDAFVKRTSRRFDKERIDSQKDVLDGRRDGLGKRGNAEEKDEKNETVAKDVKTGKRTGRGKKKGKGTKEKEKEKEKGKETVDICTVGTEHIEMTEHRPGTGSSEIMDWGRKDNNSNTMTNNASEWKLATDPNTGKQYMYNSKGETKWQIDKAAVTGSTTSVLSSFFD